MQMAKTKESIARYNREYFARPDVIARAKIRNAQRRDKRKAYKKTERGRKTNNEYRRRHWASRVGRNKHLLIRYGITIEDYDKLFEQQGLCFLNWRKGK